MCGIIGYNGSRNDTVKILINGLKNLEYRGYDSAGIAYTYLDKIVTIKESGPITNLETKINYDINSNIGIGHTRWATHGKPTVENSHPHTSGHITLVHNGIIENYAEIKEFLSEQGTVFKSETDSEIAAALLNYLYDKTENIKNSIVEFKNRVRGSYAIVFLVDNQLDKLFVIKNSSPLIVGVANNGFYVASDVPAILKNTDKYFLLDDGDFGIIKKDSFEIYDNDKHIKDIEFKTFTGDNISIDKNGYEHFMLKEIHEEPNIVRNLIGKYMNNLNSLPDLSIYKDITIVACGSAMHAGMIGKNLIEKNIGIPVSVEVASEFRYKRLFLNNNSLVIAISQSGETADTLAAVKIAKKMSAYTIGIVNVKESSIAREVDEVIYTEAGSEIAVATTKAYIAQVIILALLAFQKNNIDWVTLNKMPILIEQLINSNKYKLIASKIFKSENMFFIGRLIDYAVCMEASLKMKEISYIHSECYAAGELKHGTISLIEEGTVVFGIVTDKNIAEKTVSNLKEVASRGARIVLIISEDIDITEQFYDTIIKIPILIEDLQSIMAVIPLQLIAYETALLRGCSIDKPKNLAKSVTVE